MTNSGFLQPQMTFGRILHLIFLSKFALTLNSQNRLVQVWDSIEFYAEGTNVFQGAWNFTAFPYIDGVSLSFD